MPSGRDPIAVVEACYDLHASEGEWLQNIAKSARSIMKVGDVLAYHVDLDDRGCQIHEVVSSEAESEAVPRIQFMSELLARRRAGTANALENLQAKVYEKVIRAAVAEPVEHMLLSEIKTYGPRWMYTLGVPRVRELVHLLSHHIDGHGVTVLVGPRLKQDLLHPAERATFQMLSAHVKSGLRLRRRLSELVGTVAAPSDGAVLDASAQLVHAEGEAREHDVRALLEHKAREIDRARSRSGGRGDDALEVWQGLIDGRWSLVERFDSDGRRYLLAHKNPEQVRDPRGLSSLEGRVIGLAVRGYSDKLVAYHLGVSEGTVASCVARALRKLGLSGRAELVRTLGRYYPQTEPGGARGPHGQS